MSVVGGYLEEASFNHPTQGSGIILSKTDEDPTVDRGGRRVDDDTAGVDSGGNNIVKMVNNRWKVGFTAAIDMSGTMDEKLNAMMGDPADADWTFTYSNGIVHQGKGRPVGTLELNTGTSTMPLVISGGGKLKTVK